MYRHLKVKESEEERENSNEPPSVVTIHNYCCSFLQKIYKFWENVHFRLLLCITLQHISILATMFLRQFHQPLKKLHRHVHRCTAAHLGWCLGWHVKHWVYNGKCKDRKHFKCAISSSKIPCSPNNTPCPGYKPMMSSLTSSVCTADHNGFHQTHATHFNTVCPEIRKKATTLK